MWADRRGERKDSVEIYRAAEEEKSCEYGLESWMICSKCCTCGNHSGQLIKPLAESEEEEEAVFSNEEPRLGGDGKRSGGNVEVFELVRGRRRARKSTKREQTYLRERVLGKDDAEDEESEVEAENVH
jgi:hypothetical protein